MEMPERQPQTVGKSDIAWGADPDRQHLPWVPILRPGLGVPVRVILLSSTIEEVGLHWVDGRSVPHVRPAEQCAPCQSGQRPRTYHYAIGLGVYRGRECIALVEISADAYWGCDILKGTDLAGRTLELTRHGHVRGHVTARLGDSRKALPPMTLPSIRDALKAVWSGHGKPQITQQPVTPPENQIPI